MMFIDVRGFTSLSEMVPPTEVAKRLNRFYALASEVIFDLDGTLDKLIGDEVMAFFGAPYRSDDHPLRAVQAANRIIKGVEELGEEAHFSVGGGVATGEAFVGNVGGDEIADFTVLGDVVNTAARLQSMAQPGQIILTEETYQAVKKEFPNAEQRTFELKGKSQPVRARVIRAW